MHSIFKSRKSELLALTAALLVAKLWLAGRFDLLADEAYYWVWSFEPAWGYFDQPPWISWMYTVSRSLWGDGVVALRALPVLAGVAAPWFLVPHVQHKWLYMCWWIAVPPLFWLTIFSTPDAWLLLFWSLALASAIRGGRHWWAVGVWVSLAVLAKYTAVVLLPLLWCAAGRAEWRFARWAALPPALLLLPHAMWLWRHDFVSVRFPLSEGLLHPDPPGVFGLLVHGGGQVLVLTPIVAVVAYGWMLKRARGDTRQGKEQRVIRFAWWASAPLALGFAVASCFGPPEAHWLAPAWVGVGLGLANEEGLRVRWASIASWSALFGSGLLIGVAFLERPLWAREPLARLDEGRALAAEVERWVLPEGAARRSEEARGSQRVYAERYQEAALIHYHLGIDARAYPKCARDDQYDLWGSSEGPKAAWFVKPATGGDALCSDSMYPHKERHIMRGVDPRGEPVGIWHLWEIRRD